MVGIERKSIANSQPTALPVPAECAYWAARSVCLKPGATAHSVCRALRKADRRIKWAAGRYGGGCRRVKSEWSGPPHGVAGREEGCGGLQRHICVDRGLEPPTTLTEPCTTAVLTSRHGQTTSKVDTALAKNAGGPAIQLIQSPPYLSLWAV